MRTASRYRKTGLAIAAVAALVFQGAGAVAGDLPTDASGVCPAKIGDNIGAVRVAEATGDPVELSAVLAEAPTILILYRGGW